MVTKDSSEHKRKYNMFRHHAWAGLGFLTVLLAIRLIVPDLSNILEPIIVILLVYVVVALIFTYKYYRAGSSATEEVVQIEPSVELEKEKLKTEVDKKRLKVEKKKAKTEAKARKKGR